MRVLEFNERQLITIIQTEIELAFESKVFERNILLLVNSKIRMIIKTNKDYNISINELILFTYFRIREIIKY